MFTQTPEEGIRSHYRWLWATLLKLGIELRMSGGAASSLSGWTISPAPLCCFLLGYLVPVTDEKVAKTLGYHSLWSLKSLMSNGTFYGTFLIIICCGDLNSTGSHRLICLNAWPIGSGTIRRCGFIGGVWPSWRLGIMVEGGFEVSYAQAKPSVAHTLLLLPEDQDVELSAPFPAYLPTCCYTSWQ